MQEKLGAEGSERDVFQVFLEKLCISEVVNWNVFENLLGNITRLSPAFDNNLGVNFVLNKLLSLSQKFTGKDCNRSGTVTNLLVLGFADVN